MIEIVINFLKWLYVIGFLLSFTLYISMWSTRPNPERRNKISDEISHILFALVMAIFWFISLTYLLYEVKKSASRPK